MKKLILLLLFIPFVFSCNTSNVPAGFSKIESIEPPILIDLRYSGSDNFLGRTVKGYRCFNKSSKNSFKNKLRVKVI